MSNQEPTGADKPEWRSKCHGSRALVHGGAEGTNHFYCEACGKSCDVFDLHDVAKASNADQRATGAVPTPRCNCGDIGVIGLCPVHTATPSSDITRERLENDLLDMLVSPLTTYGEQASALADYIESLLNEARKSELLATRKDMGHIAPARRIIDSRIHELEGGDKDTDTKSDDKTCRVCGGAGVVGFRSVNASESCNACHGTGATKK